MLNRGPADERGRFDPEKASMSYSDAVARGWIRKQAKCPPFWRPALKKAIDRHLEQLEIAERARRYQLTDESSIKMLAIRMARNERLLRQHHPGWK
jgi:hypothetical protein